MYRNIIPALTILLILLLAACPGSKPPVQPEPSLAAAATLAWPGPNATANADVAGALGGNISGLAYQGSTACGAPTMWAVKNGPSVIYKMAWNGTAWASVQTDGWGAGKALRYASGTGSPDAEDLVFPDASGNVYVAVERDGSGPSKPSILQYDVSAAGTSFNAVREWNLTADLPTVSSNAGFEALTFLPDAYLTFRKFRDERLNKLYNPADYPNHGSGLLMAGLEGNGGMYVYALNHSSPTSFLRVAFVASGWPSIMALVYDREAGSVWAWCDNTCSNQGKVFDVDPVTGKFTLRVTYLKPSTLGNYNHEGITFAECSMGWRTFYWADDSATGGNVIRRDAIPCGRPYP